MEPLPDPQDLDPTAAPQSAPQPPPRPRRRSRRLAALMLAAMLAAGVGGYATARSLQSDRAVVSTTSAGTGSSGAAAAGSGGSGTGSSAQLSLAQIEAKVDPALADITAKLGTSGTAAGTGMVISSTGEILTNNHVISGATSITVQIDGTGTVYTATVVGYDATDDVAVLQIPNVTGLTTITSASASTVSANDAIVALGNALGKGGTPSAVAGTVTAVDQTITASDDSGTSAETLNGLVEISAAVEPGDSGGATVNSAGQVVGMTTAASSTGYQPMSTAATTTTAFAIPIDRALSIAAGIESGRASTTVHIGEHGLLGVEVEATNSSSAADDGVMVEAVQSGSAAAGAGIAAGADIVSVNGRSISSISDLDNAMLSTHVGDKITIGWQDASGQSHSAAVVLTNGAG